MLVTWLFLMVAMQSARTVPVPWVCHLVFWGLCWGVLRLKGWL
jgi:hypothetical protein